MIADYDLLAIFSPWRNFNQDNIRPNPEVTLAERHRKLSPREQRRSMESEERFYDREVLNLGNITPSTIGIISELNRALGKEGPLACIHHNDDAGSPASNPAANYPITVLLPSINIFNSTLLLIETTEEFVDFINKINEIGDYRVEVNPLWELPVKWAAIRKYFFCKAKLAYYRDTSSENMERTLIGMFKSINLSDATFVKELTHLFKLMVEGNCNDSLFEKFFDIIQYSLSTNSILVIKLNHSLETLYNNEALSEKNIDRLLILNNILREDRLGFYKILDNLNILSPVDAKIIDGYLKLAEAHIYNGKLNSMGFKKALKEFTLEVNVTNITIFQP